MSSIVTDDAERRAAALVALGRAGGGAGVEHPAPEHLFAYHDGSLAAAEEEAIREHLVLCPSCTRTVLEIAGVVETELPAAGVLDEREAARLAAAIRQRAGLPSSRRRRGGGVVSRAILSVAVALALVALVTMFWEWAPRREGAVAGGPLANVVVRDLVPVGAGARDREGGRSGELPSAAPAVVLVLDLADLRTFPRDRLGLSEQDGGKILWTSEALTRDGRGNFTLELTRPLPGSGLYRIDLWGLDGQRREQLAAYLTDLRAAD